jgi:hypothetical protein
MDDYYLVIAKNCRFFNYSNAVGGGNADVYGYIYCENCLFDGNSGGGAEIISGMATNFSRFILGDFIESEAKGNAADVNNSFKNRFRNVILGSATELGSITTAYATGGNYFEDYDGTIGDIRNFNSILGSNNNAVVLQSETTTVRSGGSNKSIKVTPTTNMNTNWDFGRLLILELPIYATTASKQYDIYFKTNDTANWTDDPTAAQMWIELEAWGHATNNFRQITKSTGVVDFNGSTAWQALSVTVAPAQTGVAYLRVWYAKTKEAASNVFFVDPIPVIT